ncbi:MAG: D-alanyl-D-alanine carboxypeptidase, partial [Clostridiaceae bacterium]|nr:D-alanyl-D-alanine carboxypeptidase [Clostridiaceae bacterium]
MKKIGIFLCLIFLWSNINASAITYPKITSQGAVLMDINNGKILFQKNGHGRYAPASTTKVMTALLALEKCKLDDNVIVGKNPPLEDGSKIFLTKGEVLTVDQLLYALLLHSANDAALALAEHISGSKEEFAHLMNERANQLGCKDTNFLNPNGLYESKHYTSAYDLAQIASNAMKSSKFREIVSTLSFDIAPTNNHPEIRHLHNENKLLYSQKYKYPNADGIKTGYTIKAKHTYIGSATRNGKTLVVVLLSGVKGYYKDA